jgi:hypothetical protein
VGNADTFLRNNILLSEIIFFSIAFIALAFIFWRIAKQNKETSSLLLALLVCFVVSLFPLLSLDSSFLKYIYPDRYGYLPSVFFYAFLSCITFLLLRKIAVPFLAGYSFLCWLLLMKTISVWTDTNDYCSRLIEDYKPFLKYDRVYVLDVPAYYNGVAAFRSAFRPTMFFKYDLPLDKIRFITGSYHDSPADTIHSIQISENKIEVRGAKRKTPYFSTNGGQAVSYKTEEYNVEFDSLRCAYALVFKEKIPANSAFIYARGNTWQKAE